MPRRESALIFRKSVMSGAPSRDYQKVLEFFVWDFWMFTNAAP
ncbi:MAG: hypothetical protein AABX12_02670 [Nanoarchaeota archaeon]